MNESSHRRVSAPGKSTLQQRILVVVAGPAIGLAVVTGLCPNVASADPSTSSSGPRVLINGQDQGVENMKVYCHTMPTMNGLGGVGQNWTIAIGNTGGISVSVGDTPELEHFGFQQQPFNMEYQRSTRPAADATATVTKNGNSYHATGTATGYQGTTAVTESFEVDATCP